MRINQFLAKNLGISRRQGDEIIQQSKVRLDGQKAQLFDKINSDSVVEVLKNNSWIKISIKKESSTILFYKPVFCLTTRSDPEKRKTIYDFLPTSFFSLKPAGRLDYMSEGLIVMSEDGNLIQSLTHPKNGHPKEYLVALSSELDKEFIEHLYKGINLDNYNLNPVKVTLFEDFDKYSYLKLNSKQIWYKFLLTEGRQNQIRRICELKSQKVIRLIRVRQAQFSISKELYIKKWLNINPYSI